MCNLRLLGNDFPNVFVLNSILVVVQCVHFTSVEPQPCIGAHFRFLLVARRLSPCSEYLPVVWNYEHYWTMNRPRPENRPTPSTSSIIYFLSPPLRPSRAWYSSAVSSSFSSWPVRIFRFLYTCMYSVTLILLTVTSYTPRILPPSSFLAFSLQLPVTGLRSIHLRYFFHCQIELLWIPFAICFLMICMVREGRKWVRCASI